MTIALFPNIQNQKSERISLTVANFFLKKSISVVVEDTYQKRLGLPSLSSVDQKKIKFLITMGGDGTILKIAHQYAHLNAAILGVNLGSLGFMADVQITQIEERLEEFLKGQFKIEKRMTVDVITQHQKAFFAINECTLHWAENPSLVEISIFVNDRLLNTFEADGIILATPNGSTAYSLAAGGPILSPDLEALVLTPINPHTISNRPIVLTTKETIRLEYISQKEAIEVMLDGYNRFQLKTGEHILLKRSAKTFNLVKLDSINYFETLRKKLGWTGKLRH